MNKKEAVFGAGCFWGVEDIFMKVPGVIETEVGFMGGDIENPTYEQVCSDNTSHVEVVHLFYDEDEVSYKRLLEIFFKIHDPTQSDGQGPDIGDQYRSVIFYFDEDQKNEATDYIKDLDEKGVYEKKVVTSVEEAKPFYRAEEYHQKYTQKTGRGGCHVKIDL